MDERPLRERLLEKINQSPDGIWLTMLYHTCHPRRDEPFHGTLNDMVADGEILEAPGGNGRRLVKYLPVKPE